MALAELQFCVCLCNHRVLRVSPLLGQVVAGILVGPALADIVPFADALKLLGKLGSKSN